MRLRLVATATLLALASSGCAGGFCEFFGVGDPRPIEVEDVTPLPAGYELDSSEGSCGQGRQPIDCSRTAEISPPAATSTDAAAEELRAHVEGMGWRSCDDLDPAVGRCYRVEPPEPKDRTVEVVFSHWRDDC